MAKRTGLAVLLLMVAPAVVGCSGPGDARERETAQQTEGRTVLEPDGEKGRPPRATGNQRRGSEGWRMTRPTADREVEAYTSRVSGLPGSRVGVMVSTDARSFLAQAWRMGSYRGGRLVWSSRARGHRQAEPGFAPYHTRTVVARWKPSVTVDTAGWEPGFYLFKITTDTGWQTHAPYVVSSLSAAGTRSNDRSWKPRCALACSTASPASWPWTGRGW